MKITLKDNKILTLGGKTFSLVTGVGPMYLFPESSSTFMKNAYIVGCNSLQDAINYTP